MPSPTILYVMGATNAGKSSLLAAMAEVHRARVALVEVGKAMRAKYLDPASPHYQPDYFRGQAAPEHTQAEAWSMHLAGIASGVAAGAELILVDGQPRDVPQVQLVCSDICPRYDVRFLMVHCDHAVREARLRERFPHAGGTEAHTQGFRLGSQRMVHDYQSLYLTTTEMMRRGLRWEVLDTSAMVGVDGLDRMRGVCPTIFDMYCG